MYSNHAIIKMPFLTALDIPNESKPVVLKFVEFYLAFILETKSEKILFE